MQSIFVDSLYKQFTSLHVTSWEYIVLLDSCYTILSFFTHYISIFLLRSCNSCRNVTPKLDEQLGVTSYWLELENQFITRLLPNNIANCSATWSSATVRGHGVNLSIAAREACLRKRNATS